MPILDFHLVEGQFTRAQHEKLLTDGSLVFAEGLKSPIERVRVFVHLHPPGLAAVGGELVEKSGVGAPYFRFVVLEGRPVEERQALLAKLTDLVVDVLGVDRKLVRGGCWPISPENWAIGGTPASLARAAEVKARAEAAKEKA